VRMLLLLTLLQEYPRLERYDLTACAPTSYQRHQHRHQRRYQIRGALRCCWLPQIVLPELDFHLPAHLDSVVPQMPGHSIEELKLAEAYLAVGFHPDFETHARHQRHVIHTDCHWSVQATAHSLRDYHYLPKKFHRLPYTYLRLSKPFAIFPS
jgi:hypothetical protein